MNRGTVLTVAALFGSNTVQAHVSQAQGMAHAFEHFWLLLAVAPLLLFVRPLANHLLQRRKR